jgi:hypothetical protein
MPWPDCASGVGAFSFILLAVLQAQVKVKPLATRPVPHRPI